jgi:hypothetical protein
MRLSARYLLMKALTETSSGLSWREPPVAVKAVFSPLVNDTPELREEQPSGPVEPVG